MPETCGRAALACLPKVVLPIKAMQGTGSDRTRAEPKGEVQYVRHSGGYSVGVPPLPIPNREVKPNRADGTAYSGRVGRRHLFRVPSSGKCLKEGFFCTFALQTLFPFNLSKVIPSCLSVTRSAPVRPVLSRKPRCCDGFACSLRP